MNRRRALGLFATVIGVSVSSQAHAVADAESCPEHVQWVDKVMERMGTIKPGDTRKSLLRVFTTEGGLSTGLERSYVSQACPYFMVDVQFRAVGRPEQDSDGGVETGCVIPFGAKGRVRLSQVASFGAKGRVRLSQVACHVSSS